MSVKSFADRLAHKIAHLGDQALRDAAAFTDDGGRPPEQPLAAVLVEVHKLVLKEASDWEQVRPSPSPPAPAGEAALSFGMVGKFLCPIIAGLVAISDTATVRGVMIQLVENVELWSQLKTIEGSELKGH